MLLEILSKLMFDIVNVCYGIGDTVTHINRPLKLKNVLLQDYPRDYLLHQTMIVDARKKWPVTYTYPQDVQDSTGFVAFKNSKVSIVIVNHIGGNDFIAVAELFKMAGRIQDIRFITMEEFTKPPIIGCSKSVRQQIKQIFDKFDTLLLPSRGTLTKDGKDAATIIKEYAQRKAMTDETYAIVIFPEGKLLEKNTYIQCQQFLKDKLGLTEKDMWPATCAPRVNGVDLLIKEIPHADVFDITLKYGFTGSGLPRDGVYGGDIFTVPNVMFRNLHPAQIHAKIDVLDNKEILSAMDAYKRKQIDARHHWLNQLWQRKNDYLVNLELPLLLGGKERLGKVRFRRRNNK